MRAKMGGGDKVPLVGYSGMNVTMTIIIAKATGRQRRCYGCRTERGAHARAEASGHTRAYTHGAQEHRGLGV